MTQEGKEVAIASALVAFFAWVAYHYFKHPPQTVQPASSPIVPAFETPAPNNLSNPGVVTASSVPPSHEPDCQCHGCGSNVASIPALDQIISTGNSVLSQIQSMGNATLEAQAQIINSLDPLLQVTVG